MIGTLNGNATLDLKKKIISQNDIKKAKGTVKPLAKNTKLKTNDNIISICLLNYTQYLRFVFVINLLVYIARLEAIYLCSIN